MTEYSKKKIKVNNDLRVLEFEDELKIYSLNGNEIGTFSISVSPFIFKNINCFKVKAKRYLILISIKF